MSTTTLMSAAEYLRTSFEGADREYLDGEIVERIMGSKSHGKAQGRIFYVLTSQTAARGVFVAAELRHQIRENRFRIPDVAVFESEPAEEVPVSPPLIAIEVLSPDDRIGYIVPKLAEYLSWGVRHIWLADPEDRKFFTYSGEGLHEVRELNLPEHGIALTLNDVFGASIT